MSALSDTAQGSYQEYDFATKKYGRDGREVPIFANFFNIEVNAKKIYHYNIDIQVQDFIREQGDRNVPQRNRLLQQKKLHNECNYEIFQRLVKQEAGLFGSEPVFDGRKNVYSKTKLNMTEKTITVQVKHKVPEKKYPMNFDVTITTPKDSHELDLSILKDKNLQRAEKEIQALDIILQACFPARSVLFFSFSARRFTNLGPRPVFSPQTVRTKTLQAGRGRELVPAQRRSGRNAPAPA